MNSWQRFISQTTSGRWLLTVTAGLCLLAMTLSDCWWVYTGKFAANTPMPFSVEALLSIITAVFMAYFGKTKEDTPNGNGNGNGVDGNQPPAQQHGYGSQP